MTKLLNKDDFVKSKVWKTDLTDYGYEVGEQGWVYDEVVVMTIWSHKYCMIDYKTERVFENLDDAETRLFEIYREICMEM